MEKTKTLGETNEQTRCDYDSGCITSQNLYRDRKHSNIHSVPEVTNSDFIQKWPLLFPALCRTRVVYRGLSSHMGCLVQEASGKRHTLLPLLPWQLSSNILIRSSFCFDKQTKN